MTEWQPIETAPKDGRTFLAYGAWPMFPSAPDICFCHWDEDEFPFAVGRRVPA